MRKAARITVFLVCSAVLLSAAATFTGCISLADYDEEELQKFVEPGPYVGVGFGMIMPDFDLDKTEETLGTDVDVDNTLAGDVRAGYRFEKNWAVEAIFQNVEDMEFESDDTDVAEASAWSLGANIKGFIPVHPRCHLYGLFGLGYMAARARDEVGLNIKEKEGDGVMRFGLGAEGYVNKNVGLFLEGTYNQPSDREHLRDFPFWAVMLGVQFRF